MAQTTSLLGGGVTINEIGTSPSGPSQDYNGDGLGNFSDQNIELINLSGSDIDISGWQIYENESVVHTFAPGTIITAGSTFTVVDSNLGGTITNVTGDAVFSDVAMGPSALDVIVLVDPNANSGDGAYILLEGSGSSKLGVTLAQLATDYPSATQVGTTETFYNEGPGASSQRAGDGDEIWIGGSPTPGTANVSCFLAGTWIAAPDCDRLVEDLVPGDLILTADGRSVEVRFNLRQAITKHRAVPERLEPVRIQAGTLGDGQPYCDLMVSADHGMIVDGFVINAGALVNETSIDFVPHGELPDLVTYYHIETEHHDVILANGAATETFIDYAGRQEFDNYQEYIDLYGAEPVIPEMERPRISARRLVPEAICARLGIPPEPEIDWDDLDLQDARLRA